MTNFDIVANLSKKSEKLSKKESITVFSQWLADYSIKGPLQGLQGRISKNADSVGGEALEKFPIKENEFIYLVFDYEKSKMEAFGVEEPDLKKCVNSRSDIAIIRKNFEDCLVINHEDGSFWTGPHFLLNPS